MRYLFIGIWLLCCSVTSAIAQVSVSIGINLPVYPNLVRVPGYPVYYAPGVSSNFFFYDGMYWVYEGDNWYASSWYNGPWDVVYPQYVPLYVLRVPVRYYRSPPPYFRPWRADRPPRWGDHWGREWEQRRSGWDQWNRRSAPAPAPLPSYQRQYSGDRYPQQIDRQQALRNQNYRYQPRDPAVREHHPAQAQPAPRVAAPAPVQRGPADASQDRGNRHQNVERSSPPPRSDPGFDRPPPPQAAPRHREADEAPDRRPRAQPERAPREQHGPAASPRDNRPPREGGPPQEPNRGQGQAKKDRERGDERGQ